MASLLKTLGIRYTVGHNARGVMAVTPWSGADWLNINSTYTEGIDYQ